MKKLFNCNTKKKPDTISSDKVYKFEFMNNQVNFFVNNPDDHIEKQILKNGTFYESQMIQNIIRALRPGEVFLDIGAHVGNHSVAIALSSGAYVYSFEPNRGSCERLKKNIALNNLQNRVKVYSYALSNEEGYGKILMEDERNTGRSILLMETKEESELPGAKYIPLDSVNIVGTVAAVKIDVEGHESFVLEGAHLTINRHRPDLYIEVTDPEGLSIISVVLKKWGYIPLASFNFTPTCLFKHKTKISQDELTQYLEESIGREVEARVKISEQEAIDRPRRERVQLLEKQTTTLSLIAKNLIKCVLKGAKKFVFTKSYNLSSSHTLKK